VRDGVSMWFGKHVVLGFAQEQLASCKDAKRAT
jgi:hypothetical protein